MSDSLVIIPTYNEKENIADIIHAVMTLSKEFHPSSIIIQNTMTSKSMPRPIFLVVLATLFFAFSCAALKNRKKSKFPPTEEGVRELLAPYLDPNADHEALTKSIMPSKKDIEAYFVDEVVDKVWAEYEVMLNEDPIEIGPKKGQTRLLTHMATTDDINTTNEDVLYYIPGGYKRLKGKFKPGIQMCYFKFCAEGTILGTSFPSMVYVNNHWVLIPKPWKIL